LFLGRRQIFLDDNRARPFIQSRFDLGERWSSRLVATASEGRLNVRLPQPRENPGPPVSGYIVHILRDLRRDFRRSARATETEEDRRHLRPITEQEVPGGRHFSRTRPMLKTRRESSFP
jgi:hypothetical protein